MSKYFLGIDIGTNESKGVLIDAKCNIVSFNSKKHELLNPKPGFFEHDAERDWWGDFCFLSKSLIQKSGVDPKDIGCVGLSALGCDCVPVDENCNAIYNAVLYGIDSRSIKEMEYLTDFYGAGKVSELFGHDICSSDISPKILWFKNNEPEIHKRAYKFLTGSSYLCAKLTGVYTIDKYLAEDFAPLYNLKDNTINEAAASIYCRPDQLARIDFATNIAGGVTLKAALQTGLVEGTPVLVGTGDSGAEAVSTGVFQPGDIMVQLGSTCYFVYLADRLIREDRLWPGTFIIPDVYTVNGGTNTAGTLTKWFRDEIYHDFADAELAGGNNAYAAMAADAQLIPPGSDGLICLPYFAGERTPINDPLAKGMFFGLKLTHTRAHLYRAAIEGICHTIAQVFHVLEENNLPIKKVMAVGGGAQNNLWLQCVADTLGRQVCTAKVKFGAAYGDALMAALGGGAYKSWAELSCVIEAERIIEPNDEAVHILRDQQILFEELYNTNKRLMRKV